MKPYYLIICLLLIANTAIGYSTIINDLNENEELSKLSSCQSINSTICDGSVKACCPIKNAVCCQNSDYCCPEGFKCDTENHRCLKDDLFMPFHLKEKPLLDKNEVGKEILCPDNETTCHEFQTCCLIQDSFGCCPLPSAVCCNDKIHCCPKNYVCNPDQGKCDRHVSDTFGKISIDWFSKEKGKKANKTKINNVCPGGSSECPSGTTCCQLSSGEWGCCPLPNAVCCPDHSHCCPENYVCDVKAGRCNKGDISLPFYHKIKSIPITQNKQEPKLTNVVSGGESECPSGTTCCQLSSGEFGCCPLPMAVCCSDHIHCCPNGYTCDVVHSRCSLNDHHVPFLTKIKALPIEQKVNIVCPGGSSECPSSTTCCQMSSGEWGCCPLPNAVCCEDHLHCCPQNYVCDVKAGRCNKGDISLPFYHKIKAISPAQSKQEPKLTNVVCPGGASECPTGSTCCQLSTGEWGCCPIPNAVCCEDHLHCCPENYVCDVKDGRCNKGEVSIPFLTKIAAYPIKNKPENKDFTSVLCPDGSCFCPNGNTCCKMNDGDYGCCPIPNAVCCEDNVHCCPENTHCDMVKQACVSSSLLSIPWYQKAPAKLLYSESDPKNPVEPILCDDKKTKCGPLTTCCKMSDGTFGCCDEADGVCCGDYCCPANTVCGKQKGECLNKIEKKENMSVITPTAVKRLENDIDCPTNNSTKCSRSIDQTYVCCPYSHGTCCGPHGYCCPKGYTCNDKQESCQLNDDPDLDNTNYEIQPAKLVEKSVIKSIKQSSLINEKKFQGHARELLSSNNPSDCDDGEHYCQETYTCCTSKLDGSFGCCPMENAVCCSNGINCCPIGFNCSNNSTVTCYRKN